MPYNEQTIRDLFYLWVQAPAENITALKAAGSNRCYFRISGGGKQAVATYGANQLENIAFFAIGRYARQQGVKVPTIYVVADDELHYLQEDVGDISLFELLATQDNNLLLKKTLDALAFMQVKGLQGFGYTQCYPVESFDRQSIFWDLNYFKYDFLKLIRIDIDEARLEKDFNRLADYLLTADASFFMYRDFQSRNVMVHDNEPYFIDFQGGRRGPLAYDLASFLFQVRANFSEQTREALLQHYLDALEKLTTVNRPIFIEQLYAFAFFKGLQNLGTYGYRGLFEQKELFAQSIPQAIANLCSLIDSGKLNHLSTNYLFEVVQGTRYKVQGEKVQGHSSFTFHPSPFTVTITSFSYKKGYPHDSRGNGGGFVFDCRGLNNPGRLPEFANLNGSDKEVIDYLEKESLAKEFLQYIFAALEISICNYIERGFTNLSVAFGCTGGQHRSVYCAEQTAKYLVEKYKVKVRLVHREQRIKQLLNPKP
ncbi:MAG: phosphotransferase [Prevotellaceae bacterium]|jgi:aminoglycoside/choline kinase family phosphotransferase|nr:phosphotransferase [Prevotellaceae bacterium]